MYGTLPPAWNTAYVVWLHDSWSKTPVPSLGRKEIAISMGVPCVVKGVRCFRALRLVVCDAVTELRHESCLEESRRHLCNPLGHASHILIPANQDGLVLDILLVF